MGPIKRRVTAEQQEKVKREVHKYTFFNRKLREDANKNGDIYDKRLETAQKEWEIAR
jgi:hypothetical protein